MEVRCQRPSNVRDAVVDGTGGVKVELDEGGNNWALYWCDLPPKYPLPLYSIYPPSVIYNLRKNRKLLTTLTNPFRLAIQLVSVNSIYGLPYHNPSILNFGSVIKN